MMHAAGWISAGGRAGVRHRAGGRADTAQRDPGADRHRTDAERGELNLIAFWRYGPHPEALTGMMFAIFSIAVAAAEAAVGWAW